MPTCDRCCATARTLWRDDHRHGLDLCGHHSTQHGAQLLAQGFHAQPVIDPASDTRPGGKA